MEQRFARALDTIPNLLEDASFALQVPISFALIGGLAVSAWGAVRATQDIDFLADSNPSPLRDLNVRANLKRFLDKRGCAAEWHVGGADDPVPLLLRMQLPRSLRPLGADILWAHKRWQREALRRRVAVEVARLKVFVLHPEDLVLMKLEAGGPQDLLDVQNLLSNPPPELDQTRLKRKATQLRLGVSLESCARQSGTNRRT